MLWGLQVVVLAVTGCYVEKIERNLVLDATAVISFLHHVARTSNVNPVPIGVRT